MLKGSGFRNGSRSERKQPGMRAAVKWRKAERSAVTQLSHVRGWKKSFSIRENGRREDFGVFSGEKSRLAVRDALRAFVIICEMKGKDRRKGKKLKMQKMQRRYPGKTECNSDNPGL